MSERRAVSRYSNTQELASTVNLMNNGKMVEPSRVCSGINKN